MLQRNFEQNEYHRGRSVFEESMHFNTVLTGNFFNLKTAEASPSSENISQIVFLGMFFPSLCVDKYLPMYRFKIKYLKKDRDNMI